MSDLIDRRAAIDALENDKASLDRIIRGMSANDVRLDVYVSQRNQVNYDIDTINNLPTAQLGTDLAEVGADMISRRAAIDFVENQSVWVSYTQGDWDKAKAAGDETEFVEDIIRQTKKAIQSMIQLDLPSAQPMQKKGEWIERSVFDEPQGKRIEQWQSAKCSVCGKYHTTPYLYKYTYHDFCPSCGAKMDGGDS